MIKIKIIKLKYKKCNSTLFGSYFKKQFWKTIFKNYFIMFCKIKHCLRIEIFLICFLKFISHVLFLIILYIYIISF